MAALSTIFETCIPRTDVLEGRPDSDFAADLAAVLKRAAPAEYQDPSIFFANTYPTRGLKTLLRNICLRLSGQGGEAASIFRLDTKYGGGKTHSLIALAHAAQGMKGVANVEEFVDPAIVPQGDVRVAAFDGENADPVGGRSMGNGIMAHTPWGELAYALAGPAGYERVRKNDEEGMAPGAETIAELFGGSPALILLDELSIYLRKRDADENTLRKAAKQLSAFLTGLFKAVETSPRVALVFTLAIGKKDQQANDAYAKENTMILEMMGEAESIAARKATLLDPTEEDETIRVLRRRLFSSVDDAKAAEVVEAYARLWSEKRDALPMRGASDNSREIFLTGYPLHPELIDTLMTKTSTLENFQRVRGMLRILTSSVATLWKSKPHGVYAVQLCHINLGIPGIRDEFTTRLQLKAFAPALKADIAHVGQDEPSLAERLDTTCYPGQLPYASYVARSIFLHSLAFNEPLRGASQQTIRYSILAPGVDIAYIDDALRRFQNESSYLDDRPGRPLRLMTEANLTQIIQRFVRDVDTEEVHSNLNMRIESIFGGGKDFSPAIFPAYPTDIPDNIERPQLAVISYETAVDSGMGTVSVPELVKTLYLRSSASSNAPRLNRNNVVFVVADSAKISEMKDAMREKLGLENLRNTASQFQELADHQKNQVKERAERAEQTLAIKIQQCYRHLFYPGIAVSQDDVTLTHAVIEATNAAAKPGSGQVQVASVLRSAGKFRIVGDRPDNIDYILERTCLKRNGCVTTQQLFCDYRQNPRLAILASSDLIVSTVRMGIESGALVYRCGDLIWGPNEASTSVEISDNAEVMTVAYAADNKIWPRQPQGVAEGPAPYGGSGQDGPYRPDGTTPPIPPTGPDVFGRGNAGPTPQPVTGQSIYKEGQLSSVMPQLWESVRKAKIAKVGTLEMQIVDQTDMAFALLLQLGRVREARTTADIHLKFRTSKGSECTIDFNGFSEDVVQLRQYAAPQLKNSSSTSAEFNYTVAFTNGLDMASDEPEALSKMLTTVAGPAMTYVSVTAKSSDAGE